MNLEICYVMDGKESWTYYFTDTKDFKKAVSEAKKHFTEFRKDLGWSRKAKLKHIIQMRQS